MATEIRKKILKKASLFELVHQPNVEAAPGGRKKRAAPNSKRADNPEGLLEVQIRERGCTHAGVTAKCKKRHLKELPASIRDSIVKMYLVDHVFQADIAKYYKISPALVSRLVKEAQADPGKN